LTDPANDLPLTGITVVSLEQAVAAPLCAGRLCDLGARVIKVERPEGDFARGYDGAVGGHSSYFAWINRGKESIALNLKDPDNQDILDKLIGRADVFVQNLAPGAVERLGFSSERLRARDPRLITCWISGYGPDGPNRDRKAYDLLIQAESGLVAVTGRDGDPYGRVGVSISDVSAGMNASAAILAALFRRERTGQGAHLSTSLFESTADLMSVPFNQAIHGGKPVGRPGLAHPSIAPYGAFTCVDGQVIVLSIQNEREWQRLCREVMRDEALAADPRAASNTLRVANRDLVDGRVQAAFDRMDRATAEAALAAADIAFGLINQVEDLAAHPQLRRWPMPTPTGTTADVIAPPVRAPWDAEMFRPAPAVDQHGAAIRAELERD